MAVSLLDFIFALGGFYMISITGPPCQGFSRMNHTKASQAEYSPAAISHDRSTDYQRLQEYSRMQHVIIR